MPAVEDYKLKAYFSTTGKRSSNYNPSLPVKSDSRFGILAM